MSTFGPFSVGRTAGHIHEPCGFDGVLGTDFLIGRRCTLTFELGPEAGDNGRFYTRARGFCEP